MEDRQDRDLDHLGETVEGALSSSCHAVACTSVSRVPNGLELLGGSGSFPLLSPDQQTQQAPIKAWPAH